MSKLGFEWKFNTVHPTNLGKNSLLRQKIIDVPDNVVVVGVLTCDSSVQAVTSPGGVCVCKKRCVKLPLTKKPYIHHCGRWLHT
jgi:hypothetical protein